MSIQINPLSLDGVIEIIPQKFGDDRGFFSETYNLNTLKSHNIDTTFVQDNHSYSKDIGVLRGLHFQCDPRAQAKLVRVVRGRIFDVAVDIRQSSPDFGKWLGIEISATKWNQLLIPVGFAHGFMTLEPDCEIVYKTSQFYSSQHDCSIRFDDPDIAIDWPAIGHAPILSEKDTSAPMLRETGRLPT